MPSPRPFVSAATDYAFPVAQILPAVALHFAPSPQLQHLFQLPRKKSSCKTSSVMHMTAPDYLR